MKKGNNIVPLGKPHMEALYHIDVYREESGKMRVKPTDFRALPLEDKVYIIGGLERLLGDLKEYIGLKWTDGGEE